jgi:ribose transport system ATP-binding protein
MVGGAVSRTSDAEEAVGGDPVLLVKGLCGTVLYDVSFEARAGRVLGFAGLTGSGREELLPLIFGNGDRHGEVRVGEHVVRPGRPSAAIDAGLALVPADRLRQGGIFDLSLAKNLTLSDLGRLRGPSGAISGKHEREEVLDWISRLDVRPGDPDLPLAAISGGNQQKVVIAKWLRMNPQVLLLDEPTQGVDVGAKARIHDLVRQTAAAGTAVVIASSDDEELCDVCDEIYVLRDGEIAARMRREEASIDKLGLMQLSGTGNVMA